MGGAGVGQVVDRIHFLAGERDRRRVQPQVTVAVALDEGAGVAGIGLPVQHPRGTGIGLLVVLDLVIGGEPDHGLAGTAGGGFVGRIEIVGGQLGVMLGHAAEQGDAPDGVELVRRRAGREAVRHLDHGALGIAVEQKVGLRVRQDRAAHLVGPVIVMGDAAQGRLDAAEDDRHILVGLAAALRVDDCAAVRAGAALSARRVGVVASQATVRRVAVHHRIEIAAGDAEEHIRPAERLERLRRLPVGLGDDADPEPLRFEQPADDRHAEARMIDIGIPVTRTMSQASHPSASISARHMGRNGAAFRRGCRLQARGATDRLGEA